MIGLHFFLLWLKLKTVITHCEPNAILEIMSLEELKSKCMSGSKMILTEGDVLDAYVFLSTGGTIDDYPNKEELQRVKNNFNRLAGL